MEAGVAMDDHADGLSEVFAFGSNLDLTDFIAWCRRERGLTPKIERISWAWLRDYRFSWDYYSPVRRGGAANINPAAGYSVAGVVFKVDSATLAALDAKEGHPERYLRQMVTVECMDAPKGMREGLDLSCNPNVPNRATGQANQGLHRHCLEGDSRTRPSVSLAC